MLNRMLHQLKRPASQAANRPRGRASRNSKCPRREGRKAGGSQTTSFTCPHSLPAIAAFGGPTSRRFRRDAQGRAARWVACFAASTIFVPVESRLSSSCTFKDRPRAHLPILRTTPVSLFRRYPRSPKATPEQAGPTWVGLQPSVATLESKRQSLRRESKAQNVSKQQVLNCVARFLRVGRYANTVTPRFDGAVLSIIREVDDQTRASPRFQIHRPSYEVRPQDELSQHGGGLFIR